MDSVYKSGVALELTSNGCTTPLVHSSSSRASQTSSAIEGAASNHVAVLTESSSLSLNSTSSYSPVSEMLRTDSREVSVIHPSQFNNLVSSSFAGCDHLP